MILDQIVNQPLIEADQFDLRPLRRGDAGLIDMYAGDERIARMTSSIPHPLPPGTTDAFIARAIADERCEDVWAIDGSKSKGAEIKGLISLKKLDRDQSEIGYWIAPVFWNSGIASAAVSALIAANPQGCTDLFATVFQDNPASARVLTRCGFEYIGDAEQFSVARDAAVPTWTYIRKL